MYYFKKCKFIFIGINLLLLTACTDGFFLAQNPLDGDNQYTSNEFRTFIIAGCVPLDNPFPVGAGSNWIVCNDLDFAKDKVVETEFVSCLDIFRNGVISGIQISEVRNRRWDNFNFLCRDMQTDGTLGQEQVATISLVQFERTGTSFETQYTTDRLAMGVFEINNLIQLRESLLTIAIEHASANDIYAAGQNNSNTNDIMFSPKIPDSSPPLIGKKMWNCPSGMVLTGGALGHIPNDNNNATRPIYILGECRTLIKL